MELNALREKLAAAEQRLAKAEQELEQTNLVLLERKKLCEKLEEQMEFTDFSDMGIVSAHLIEL